MFYSFSNYSFKSPSILKFKGQLGSNGSNNNENRNANMNGGGGGGEQQPSIFENINRQLITSGFPRFQLGPWNVEPIMCVGLVLAMFLMGIKGLLLVAFLFVIVNMSNSQNNNGGGGGFASIISSFFGGTPNNNNQANRRQN